jgi:hypothetical protein
MKTHLPAIKIVASLLLILSFFLPMSSCSYTVPIDADTPGSAMETRIVINYAREYVDLTEVGGWLNILAFFWPFPLFLLQWRYGTRKHSWLLAVAGTLLSILSAVAVYTWADIGTPLVGAWVGGGAAVALFTIYVIELTAFLRGRLSGKWKKEIRDR